MHPRYVSPSTLIDDIYLGGAKCESVPGLFSKETVKNLKNFGEEYQNYNGYVAIILCIFALFTNGVGVYVLTRRTILSPSANIILTWIGVANLIYVSIYVPEFSYFFIIESATKDIEGRWSSTYLFWVIYDYAIFTIIGSVWQYVQVWLIIALAIFRYIYIQFPFKASKYCSKVRAKYTVAATIVASMCGMSPFLLLYTYEIIDHQTNHTTISSENVTQVTTSTVRIYNFAFNSDYAWLQKPNSLVNGILFSILPGFLLIVVTVLLLHALHTSNKRFLRLTANSTSGTTDERSRQIEHKRSTMSVSILTLMLVVVEVPFGIGYILKHNVECFRVVYVSLYNLMETICVANSALLFLLLMATIKQFRKAVVDIFFLSNSNTQHTTLQYSSTAMSKRKNENDMNIDTEENTSEDDEDTFE